jgi:acetyl-CoA carboxylase biotin carboxyl carrier protein
MSEKNNLPVDKINQLSQILKDQGLTEIEIEVGDTKIRVRKEASVISAPNLVANAPITADKSNAAETSNAGLHLVKSPMVGTFYASPSPDSAPFIKVGDRVTKGQTLCIVEAMKLMNEFPSDVDGEVVEICVQDSSAISFGQVIIKIKP